MQQNNSNIPSQPPTTHVFSIIGSNNYNNSSSPKSKEVARTQKHNVLLEWLTEPGNFQRYRGIGGKSAKNKNSREQRTRNSNGDTRDKVLTSIVARLHQHKLTHRTKHTVGCHLQEWVTKFNKAQDLVNRGTGGGGPSGEGSILNEQMDPNNSGDDNDNTQNSNITDIKSQVKRIFKYYYELEAVMGDTHSSNPLYLSESIHFRSPSVPSSQVQTSAPEVSMTTYTTAVDSAVDELNDRDHNEFISEEAATDRGLQIEQNQQSSFSTQDVSSRSKNKKEKQMKKNPIAQIIWDINQHNSKYFEKGLAIKQALAKHKQKTDLELLAIKRQANLIKERESKTNLIKAMANAGFSTDLIPKELTKDSKKEKECQRLYNDEQEGISESDDDNVSLDSTLQASVLDYHERDAVDDEELESEDNESDDESIIIMENQQREEEDDE
ncbi:hypothetical protein INT45_013745 [Circinella minor]|uniref:Uncharacterized protein n=1 Tax=Circinella minor TaxID=1195481 RepID=A0A8H7RI63_9FUNG|nr:hypothetical protein INT45_013745 [Circinella minor]